MLITADDLAQALDSEAHLAEDSRRTRVLDVRWTLAEPDGKPAFESGHIPSAVYVDLDSELSRPGTPREGRHPLPHVADLQRAARGWGLRTGDRVVAYDGYGNLASARLWWLLRWAGVQDVRLLDGALPAWVDGGHSLETGTRAQIPGDITLSSGHMPEISLENIPGFIQGGGALIDARAPERYRGESEPVDPRAGHIPGALSGPTGDNLDANGRFLSGPELQKRFASLGVKNTRSVASSCGSGVTAAHTLFALALTGIEGALYPGSWSQWSNHPELPVVTGGDPE